MYIIIYISMYLYFRNRRIYQKLIFKKVIFRKKARTGRGDRRKTYTFPNVPYFIDMNLNMEPRT